MTRHTKTLRILVADDHGLVRSGIRGLLLAHRGWKLEGEAVDGVDAVAKANKLKPDLAIIDIAMPNLDGLETTRQILETNPDIAVLILTMHESSQMVRRVLEAGARGYVLKSDLVGHLVKAVKAVSRGKMYLTPKVSSIVLEGFLKAGKESNDRNSQAKPTPREQEVIRLLAKGQGNKEIATALGITVRTVETHRARIMSKLGLHSLTELVHYAIRNRLVSSEVL
ncbi:MAG: response regulator transcription factor [Candidatus Acidiferrales bacterium]|jgi:two-component system response regulator NreC